MMLRSLGQNPTDDEVNALIASVDDGDMDGQIQLREFLKLYTQSLDDKKSGAATATDVSNVFMALGGDASTGDALDKGFVREFLLEQYQLDIDPEVLAKLS